jgi:hypothetical protein
MIPAELLQRADEAVSDGQGDALTVWLADPSGHIAVSSLGLKLVADINRLVVPTLRSTEQAIAWGSRLDVREHAALVDMQRRASDAALDEESPQQMVNLATRSQLLREAANAFTSAAKGSC